MHLQDSIVTAYIERIKTGDAAEREAALKEAASLPATAVAPLAELIASGDQPIARAAQESLRRLVVAAGGKRADARKISAELVKLIGKGAPRTVRAQALILLGGCAGPESVRAIAVNLSDPDVREDARTALERIPSSAATAALRSALTTSPTEFRPAIQQSLRRRNRRSGDAGIV